MIDPEFYLVDLKEAIDKLLEKYEIDWVHVQVDSHPDGIRVMLRRGDAGWNQIVSRMMYAHDIAPFEKPSDNPVAEMFKHWGENIDVYAEYAAYRNRLYAFADRLVKMFWRGYELYVLNFVSLEQMCIDLQKAVQPSLSDRLRVQYDHRRGAFILQTIAGAESTIPFKKFIDEVVMPPRPLEAWETKLDAKATYAKGLEVEARIQSRILLYHWVMKERGEED